MKKLFTLVFLIFIVSISAFAQTETPTTANWQFLAPENEEFSIELPVSPSADFFTTDKLLRHYYGANNGTYFYISSDPLNNPAQYKVVESFIKTFQSAGKPKNIGGFKAEKYSFADSDNFYHNLIIAKTKNRIYVFQTISETEKDPTVDRFFVNLKINEKRDLKMIEVLTVPAERVLTVPAEQVVNGTGSGAGKGVGNGVGNGAGSGSPNNNAPIQSTKSEPLKTSSPLSISAKPRANYTDFARFYGITGNVYLKIVFLSNGEIGTVTTTKKLPFGLTQSAIEAAKKIRFTPAIKDGMPISLTKTVVYSFVIY